MFVYSLCALCQDTAGSTSMGGHRPFLAQRTSRSKSQEHCTWALHQQVLVELAQPQAPPGMAIPWPLRTLPPSFLPGMAGDLWLRPPLPVQHSRMLFPPELRAVGRSISSSNGNDTHQQQQRLRQDKCIAPAIMTSALHQHYRGAGVTKAAGDGGCSKAGGGRCMQLALQPRR